MKHPIHFALALTVLLLTIAAYVLFLFAKSSDKPASICSFGISVLIGWVIGFAALGAHRYHALGKSLLVPIVVTGMAGSVLVILLFYGFFYRLTADSFYGAWASGIIAGASSMLSFFYIKR